MVDPDAVDDLVADPYRVACPRGHTALVPAETSPSAYCRTCAQSYPATELIDRRRGPGPCKPHRKEND
jgi:hypothetical protein